LLLIAVAGPHTIAQASIMRQIGSNFHAKWRQHHARSRQAFSE
jgi:hypothetical protein